jgi:hypothetical protein
MNIATIIISAVSFIALFWILYIYSVRRARDLVQLELESHSENITEKKQTIRVVGNDQSEDTNEVSVDTKPASVLKPEQLNRNVQIKPSIAAGVVR